MGVAPQDGVWHAIAAQRLALADVLGSLGPAQWDAPSLCEGWRVRDVAAHLTLSTRARPLAALVGVIRSGGRFNRFVARDARARSGRPPAELVAELRAAAASRHRPPFTRPEDPLVDVLVHTLDITVPLGLGHALPLDAVAVAADRVWSMSFPFFARRRARGVRLVATDTDWRRGEGAEATGPIAALLLVLTGRRRGLELLDGPGVDVLAGRFG